LAFHFVILPLHLIHIDRITHFGVGEGHGGIGKIEYLRTEYLAQKIDFDETIEELGTEIKHSWWQHNKAKYIQEK
jgi:hypothetical protein